MSGHVVPMILSIKYYFPYFGESSEIFELIWQDETAGRTYVNPGNSN